MEPPARISNRQIAAILFEVADLLDTEGVKFKPIAYRRAAHVIETLSEDVADLNTAGKLEEIPGVGSHIANKIREILNTGKLEYYDRLKSEIPPGVLELAELGGIGPKKAMVLSKTLGITDTEGLEKAANEGKIRVLKGFGEKTEKNILLAIQAKKGTAKRFLLGDILPVAEAIRMELAALPATKQISLAGSIRRMKETIGDVDILATSSEPETIMTAFCTLPEVDRVLGKGPTKSSVVLKTGVQVDLRVVGEDQFWTALMYFTGSKDHNIAMRRLALDRNWRLNEYGLTDLATWKKFPVKSEEDLYRLFDLPYIEPELRENRGEIDAAANGGLPVIVPYGAVKGDLHVHTTGSDGKNSIKEMAVAAQALGYNYIAVCDHSWSPQITRGLTEEGIRKQGREIGQVNRELDGFVVLAGIECNITVDGALDLGNSVLRDLDVVLASVHSGLDMPEKEMTERVLGALHNDELDILGHPTGRILRQREPAQMDLAAVFDAARELRVYPEINAYPSRLDFSDINCMIGREHGVRFAISSDAHSRENLRSMELGVATARRGWLEAGDIINTLPVKDLRNVLGA
jgi:DNA polymerase (family 10)